MFEKLRGFKTAMVAVALIALLTAVGGLVISQAAGGSAIQATVYDDAVRFTVRNDRVEILRAEVFDLAGKRLFDSGPTMGNALDWAMTTEAGERVAHGVYLYVITAWDSGGELLKSQVGKLALVPGGVGLGQAPTLASESKPPSTSEKGAEVRALAYDTTDWYVSGQLGVGTDSPTEKVEVSSGSVLVDVSPLSTGSGLQIKTGSTAAAPVAQPGILGRMDTSPERVDMGWGGQGGGNMEFYSKSHSSRTGNLHFIYGGGNFGQVRITHYNGSSWERAITIDSDRKVGVGTTSPSAALEVHGSTTNLLALYDPVVPTDAKFRVEKDGDVRADGAYYSGTGGYYTGSADVAERINTSEWVEQGNVVEIDPEHPGFFRKTRTAHSTNVAGVISTSPGVVLGNNFDAQADKWEDNRPMLALAGRVPVKVTAENGPIQVGDLLVSSSQPGYAMRCSDRAACVAATIGKALEPLEEGTGEIMVQVTLR